MLSLILNPFIYFFRDSDSSHDILFFSFLVILLPIALITGPAIPDIIVSITASYFLIKSLLKRLWSYYLNKFFWIFLTFCIYSSLRSFTSELPIESINNEGSIFYFRYLFFSLAIWYFLDNLKHFSNCLLIVILLCLLVVILDGLFQYIVGVNIFGNEKHNDYRLTGFFGDEPIIGRYIAYLSIFAFCLIYQNYSKTKKMIIFSIALLVVCEVMIFLTGERSPLFYITFFSILLVIYIPQFRIYRLAGVIVSIILISIILQFNPNAKQRMVDFTISEIKETNYPYLPYTELHERHYVLALKMFKEKPIFGVGTNLFRYLCDKDKYLYKPRSCTSHPHHFYIQLLAELGIIGFLFLSSFFAYLSFVGLKQLKYLVKSEHSKMINFEHFLIFMILFVYWWPLIPHMSFYNNWNNILMMLPLGFLLRYLYRK